jgi:hypothetical protein
MITDDDLKNDVTFNTYIRQYANTALDYSKLILHASRWWIELIKDDRFTDEILPLCMKSASYYLSNHLHSGVIGGVVKDEQEIKYSRIWMGFMYQVIASNKELVGISWSAVKKVCEMSYPRDEEKYKKILYQEMPSFFTDLLEGNKSLSDLSKADILFSFTNKLPEPDRGILEEYFVKNKPSFIT